MIVDAHVHVWDPRVLTYPWLQGAGPSIERPFLPAAIDRADGATSAMVFVQADCRHEQSVAEVAWAAQLDWPELAGIVAASDVRAPRLDWALDELSAAGPVHGIRYLLQGEPVERFREVELQRGLAILAVRDLPFDACVRHEQLDALADLLERVPDLRVVLDHVGKPPVEQGIESFKGAAWRAATTRIAALPNTYVKLSGLIAEAPDEVTLRAHAGAFIDHALAAFGARRTMLGSDWPVSGLWGPNIGLAAWAEFVRGRTADDAAWADVSGTTARRFYRLEA